MSTIRNRKFCKAKDFTFLLKQYYKIEIQNKGIRDQQTKPNEENKKGTKDNKQRTTMSSIRNRKSCKSQDFFLLLKQYYKIEIQNRGIKNPTNKTNEENQNKEKDHFICAQKRKDHFIYLKRYFKKSGIYELYAAQYLIIQLLVWKIEVKHLSKEKKGA